MEATQDLRRYKIHSWIMYHMMNGENILFPAGKKIWCGGTAPVLDMGCGTGP